MSTSPPISRYVPDAVWPPYAFVPGRSLPHPVRDPAGHLFGVPPLNEVFDPQGWQGCRAYRWGVDLFNHGFYWEAHEVWEGIWRGHRREDTPAIFLQGLIKLAAAGVKIREGVPAGVTSLANGAAAHFHEIHARGAPSVYCGLNVAELATAAEQVAKHASALPPDRGHGPRIVFAFGLRFDE